MTATAAHGCAVRVFITPGDGGEQIVFGGKWTSRVEPIATHLVTDATGQLQRVDRYDPQKLPGIHDITLEPGLDGDLVAIAIRERGASNAYAYWAERVYAQAGGRPFPEHPDCELPPGTYEVVVRARAGEVVSPFAHYRLTVGADDDSLSLVSVS